jgi:hypothetical protein
LLPVVFYLLFLFLLKKIHFAKRILPYVSIFLILYDIYFFKEIYIGILLGLIIIWIISIKICKIESRVSFLLALIFFIAWIINLIFQQDMFSIKLNIWTYNLFFTAVIQAVIEEGYLVRRKIT